MVVMMVTGMLAVVERVLELKRFCFHMLSKGQEASPVAICNGTGL